MTEQTYADANDVLMGGGDSVPYAKFPVIGATFDGIVKAAPKAFEEREFNQTTKRSDGPVKKFPSGDSIMGVSCDFATAERDPMDPEDDGTRRLFIQGRLMKAAVRDAIQAAGATGLEIGGRLRLQYIADEPMGTVTAKKYSGQYWSAATMSLGTAPAPVAQPTVAAPVAAQPVAVPASVPAPAPAAPAAPVAGQPSAVDIARQMFAIPGMSDPQIAAATGLADVVVAALRAQG